VRWLPLVLLVYFGLPSLWAQQQERSLIDRLLRPDLELQNSAQNKKFPMKSAAIERRDTALSPQPNSREKSFDDMRTVSTKQYPSRPFNSGSMASSGAENRTASVPVAVQAVTIGNIRNTHDADASIPSRSFAGQRPFRGEGKSQKLLNRRNPPLTIEQVRELLNKNK
jgi:hypothetical protein